MKTKQKKNNKKNKQPQQQQQQQKENFLFCFDELFEPKTSCLQDRRSNQLS